MASISKDIGGRGLDRSPAAGWSRRNKFAVGICCLVLAAAGFYLSTAIGGEAGPPSPPAQQTPDPASTERLKSLGYLNG